MQSRAIRVVLAGLAVAAMVTIPQSAAAQRRGRRPRPGRRPRVVAPFAPRALPEFGLRGGYDFDTRSGSLGADFRLPVGRRGHFALAPSSDIFFNEPGHDWQANLDGELRAPRIGLYGGGGAAVIHHRFQTVYLFAPSGARIPVAGDPETKLGWNLFAGLEPSATRLPVRPYVETRWTLRGEDYSAFRLVAGLHVPIGRRARAWRRGRP